jgi:tyrosyl-tRNA synthetase
MKMTNNMTDLDEVLSRAVSDLIDPDGSFRAKLQKKVQGQYNKDIIIKLGIDPTRPDIHLGFAVVLRKLRKFQDLGCKVVFLIGNYTAQIGDPEGKSKVRPELDAKEIEQNAKTYIEQVSKILKTEPQNFSWITNSDWYYSPADLAPPSNINAINMEIVSPEGQKNQVALDPNSMLARAVYYDSTRMQRTHLHKQEISAVTLLGLMWTLRNITHSKLIQRDMFQERIKSGSELYMHEMLYPVLQGIDSSMIGRIYGSCDLEIGGTDQHFNMLIGREVMKANKQEPQAVMTMEILAGTDGKEKMSKSLDNYIGITEAPEEMFGKVMSIPDSAIASYFKLATYTPLPNIEDIEKELQSGKVNPRDIKARLAKEIVEIYHGREKAEKAEVSFNDVFKKGGVPENVTEITSDGKTKLVNLLLNFEIISSKSEFRRLIEEGAVCIVGGEKISDAEFIPKETMSLRIGKKRFAKIII